MTLYEFNLLDDTKLFNDVWDRGIYLNSVEEYVIKIHSYAIDIFFVEACYDSKSNKIIEKRSFKEGHRLDK